MGQAEKDGSFRIEALPRQADLRLCALYDVDRNRSYEPGDDLWGCLDHPLSIDDTVTVARGLEIYLVLEDEPGSLEGAVIDSSCIGTGAEQLVILEHEADSMSVLIGENDAGPADTLLGFERERPGAVDTVAVRGRLAAIDSLRALARSDSSRCAAPVIVRLLDQDSTLVEESRGSGAFSFGGVEPGVYRITGFRDLDGDGFPGPEEARGGYSGRIELLPGRQIKDLNFHLH
jgi:hypothetical protein